MFTIPDELRNKYLKYVTENRLNKMMRIIDNRTNKITVLLEDINNSQNISAIVRTAEGFGLNTIHVVEGKKRFRLHKLTTKRTDKWLTIFRYKSIEDAFNKLHKKGYKIYYGSSAPENIEIEKLKFEPDEKIALVFGQELLGISDYVKKNADASFKISMYGFVESFNVSVAAGIAIYEISKHVRNSINWQLTENEKLDLLEYWMKRNTDY